MARPLSVHLTYALASKDELRGGLAVVIDVLRATTTIVHALAAGCTAVRPVADVDEARRLADGLPAGKVLLAGERGGRPLPGFDLGNSPAAFTAARCQGTTLVLTTTNGTRALLHAAAADRVLAAGFVNFSAVCEHLLRDERPLHFLCAGSEGQIALEDALLAGAFVEALADTELELNDGARLAWDSFEHHGAILGEALRLSQGGRLLAELGFARDVEDAGRVDRFALVPELRQDPLRLVVGAVGVTRRHWPGR